LWKRALHPNLLSLAVQLCKYSYIYIDVWNYGMAVLVYEEPILTLGGAIRSAIAAAIEAGDTEVACALEEILLIVPGEHGGYYRA
jgi:hypothetical protein